MWIPALVAAAALASPAPQEAPKSPESSQAGIVAYASCSWTTSDGGTVVVTCSSWNSCTMTRYDSKGKVVRQINITPDWC